jgi:hypothetical protein
MVIPKCGGGWGNNILFCIFNFPQKTFEESRGSDFEVRGMGVAHSPY